MYASAAVGGSPAATVAVAVLGLDGRMGRAVASLLESAPGLRLAGGWCREPAGVHLPSGGSGAERPIVSAILEDVLRGASVAIDFTLPEATAQVSAACVATGCPLVSGVTGLTPAHNAALDKASKTIAVLHATNMSAGAHLLMHLAARAASVLDEAAWDTQVLDVHHRDKRDAPSGTALSLGEAVAAARGRKLSDVRLDPGEKPAPGDRSGAIAFSAQRGGGVVGEHTVSFLADFETLELSHRARDRRVFAAGALRAACWLAGREPGRYTMSQVLGLS